LDDDDLDDHEIIHIFLEKFLSVGGQMSYAVYNGQEEQILKLLKMCVEEVRGH